jgi:hypothetical protein
MRMRIAVGPTMSTVLAIALALASPAAAARPPVPLDDAQLAAAVLTGDDITDSDWGPADAGTIEPEPHTQANDIEGGWCGGATDAYAAGELHTSGTATTTLSKIPGPDEPYWFVWQSLRSFQEAFGNTAIKQAKNFMKTIKDAATSCPSWTTSGGEITNSISPATVPFPRSGGNQRLAFELTTAGDGVTETTYVVYVRAKNNVVSIHTRILPADADLLEAIVKRAVRKMKQAAAA